MSQSEARQDIRLAKGTGAAALSMNADVKVDEVTNSKSGWSESIKWINLKEEHAKKMLSTVEETKNDNPAPLPTASSELQFNHVTTGAPTSNPDPYPYPKEMFAKYKLNGDSLYGRGNKPLKMKDGHYSLWYKSKRYNLTLDDLRTIYKT